MERAGVGLVAVGLAGVRDDYRPVLQIGCNARGGFDGDVGGDTDEHDSVDACRPENGVERGAVESVGRLSPDNRLIGPGAMASMTSTEGVPCRRVGFSTSVRNNGEFGLTPGNPG
jgi:hypothetical protein